MTISKVNPVQSTYDYDLFEFFESNRDPLHWKKIAQSIEKKDLTPYVPILVAKIEGVLYIVDGQNRFLACKHLKKPVYYQLLPPDCGEDTMIMLNIDRKNWTPENYLNFWVAQGNPDYIRLSAVLNECGNLKVSDSYRIWQSKKRGITASKTFASGKYKFPMEAVKKARLVSSILFVIEECVDKREFSHHTSLVSSIAAIINCGAKPSRLISAIKKYPFLYKKQPTHSHYSNMLEHIYNYRRRDKIAFRYMNETQ